MKTIISYVLLLAFSATFITNSIIVAEYLIRFDYYSSEACKNLEEPKLNCQGTCHLQNELKTEQTSNEPMEQLELFAFECLPLDQLDKNKLDLLPVPLNSYIENFKPSNFINRHFHPPQV